MNVPFGYRTAAASIAQDEVAMSDPFEVDGDLSRHHRRSHSSRLMPASERIVFKSFVPMSPRWGFGIRTRRLPRIMN
jgi:hypothetical protein